MTLAQRDAGAPAATILVVDDEPGNRRLLRAQLEAEGYAVLEAGDGAEALELLARNRVDAVMSDIFMPNIDGFRLCRRIREDAGLRHTPVVLLTSTFTTVADERLARELGVAEFLRRPAGAGDVTAAVRHALAAPHGNAPPPAALEADVQARERVIEKLERYHGTLARALASADPRPDPSLVGLFGRLSKLAAATTCAIGATVLAAWMLDLPRLASLIEGGVTMKASTALAFVLAGAALLLVQSQAFATRPGRAAAAACAGAVGVIGALSLARSLLGWDLGIDQFLAQDQSEAPGTAYPGRVAMLTAANLILLAAGLLLVDVEVAGRWRPAQLLAVAALAITFVPALGYAYSAHNLLGFPADTRMALPTVLAFIALSLGLLAARPDRGLMALCASSGLGGRMARLLLPVTLLLPAVIGGLRLAGERAGWYGAEFGVALFVAVVAIVMTFVVGRYSVTLERTDKLRRHTELQVGELIEHAPDAMLMVDERGVMQMANAEAERLFGYPRHELVGAAVELLVPDALRAGHVAQREAFMREPSRRMLGAGRELSGRHKDGSLVPVEIMVCRVDVGPGVWFMATVRDVTARRRAEVALRNIEWMLTKGATRDVTLVTAQPYGDLTALNTERTILDAVGKELLHDIVSDYMGLLETSSAVCEKNGDYAYGIFTSGWCQAMDYASWRGCGTTDNRQALKCGQWHCHESCWNEASRVSMERREPIDIACRGGIRLYAVPILAGGDVIGSINFGYGRPPQDEATLALLAARYGLTVAEVQRQAAAYRERPPFIVELAKQRLAGSARLIGEIVQRRRAEEAVRREKQFTESLNSQLEERVRARTAQLEAANKDLEGFSYTVSHDLRAPLRAIDNFSSFMLEDHAAQLDAEGRRLLGVIRRNAADMSRLIDDVLAFARAGRTEVAAAAVDMGALAADALAGLTVAGAPAAACDIGELPAARGDARMLRQVLVNLIGNALKFAGGRAGAEVRVRGRLEDGAAIYEVSDNGVGFDGRFGHKLFGVFQRLHRSEEFPGTGIGLAIVKRIVMRHGGRVWAESHTDRPGATFGFSVPAATDPVRRPVVATNVATDPAGRPMAAEKAP